MVTKPKKRSEKPAKLKPEPWTLWDCAKQDENTIDEGKTNLEKQATESEDWEALRQSATSRIPCLLRVVDELLASDIDDNKLEGAKLLLQLLRTSKQYEKKNSEDTTHQQTDLFSFAARLDR